MIKAQLMYCLAASLCLATGHITISTADVTAEFPGAPRVQSFSFAQWKGRWVIIGGRTAGYHGVGGGVAEFLKADANREVWVIDTTVKPARTYHVPLDQLSDKLAPVKEQWSSTAQLSVQDGSVLYIAGGYGQNRSGGWVTFPLISRIELPSFIEGVMQGRIPEASITFAESPAVQSTGGELVKLPDGYFYLAMGHVFTGSYTTFQGQQEQNRPAASQVYLNEIRKLRITPAKESSLRVTLVETLRDPVEFHRRDLNVTRVMSPKGLGLAVYGGVFTPQTQLAYTKPIYLFPGAAPSIDKSFDQRMNAYACATMLMYDPVRETMHTTFFGGISRHSWDAVSRHFVENPRVGSKTDSTYLDGLQWSDQISTIRRVMTTGKEETSETVQDGVLPTFLGADAVFVPSPEIPRAHPASEILDIRALGKARTLVGYLFGGIRASPFRFPYTRGAAPYNSGAAPTKPSDLVLAVYVENAGR